MLPKETSNIGVVSGIESIPILTDVVDSDTCGIVGGLSAETVAVADGGGASTVGFWSGFFGSSHPVTIGAATIAPNATQQAQRPTPRQLRATSMALL